MARILHSSYHKALQPKPSNYTNRNNKDKFATIKIMVVNVLVTKKSQDEAVLLTSWLILKNGIYY